MKFGYAVTGLVHPDQIWTNAGARPGDVLVLTKPLGTGVIGTALKRGIADPAHVEAAVQSMCRLNRFEGEAHGCTDITGFGLIGHAREMALASGVTLEIDASQLEFLPGALEYAARGAIPGGLNNNREFASCAVELRRELPPEIEALLYDPQTSGGLLLSVDPAKARGSIIGRVIERAEKPIVIV
jgi:selenide,water dikinase